ncbi:MAG: hypothetical protein AB7T49_12500 [Oligoflexales bacterium]
MLLKLRWIVQASLLVISVGCTHTDEPEPTDSERLEVEKPAEKQDDAASKNKTLPIVKDEPPEEPCLPPEEQGISAPAYLDQSGIMVTQVVNECLTKDNEGKIKEEIRMLAMGFPCTAGKGEVDITGYASSPKMVAFNISNSCPMSPQGQHEAKARIEAEWNLGSTANLLAYFPMSIQYWELEGYSEADVGSSVELRSSEGLSQAWKTFLKGQPLHLKVFGRENAWLAQHHMYQADVELLKQTEQTFKVKVVSMKVLNNEELEDARKRCLTSLSQGTCGDVFGG